MSPTHRSTVRSRAGTPNTSASRGDHVAPEGRLIGANGVQSSPRVRFTAPWAAPRRRASAQVGTSAAKTEDVDIHTCSSAPRCRTPGSRPPTIPACEGGHRLYHSDAPSVGPCQTPARERGTRRPRRCTRAALPRGAPIALLARAIARRCSTQLREERGIADHDVERVVGQVGNERVGDLDARLCRGAAGTRRLLSRQCRHRRCSARCRGDVRLRPGSCPCRTRGRGRASSQGRARHRAGVAATRREGARRETTGCRTAPNRRRSSGSAPAAECYRAPLTAS